MRNVLKNGDAVRNKDCMAVDPILDLTSSPLCTILERIGPITHTLVPELGKFTDDNKIGMFPHPVDISVGSNGMPYTLDDEKVKQISVSTTPQSCAHASFEIKPAWRSFPDYQQ